MSGSAFLILRRYYTEKFRKIKQSCENKKSVDFHTNKKYRDIKNDIDRIISDKEKNGYYSQRISDEMLFQQLKDKGVL